MYRIPVENFADWRNHARALLQRRVSPDHVQWQVEEQCAFDFDCQDDYINLPIQHDRIVMPKTFMELAERVSCYRCATRWPLLYRLAWRILFENRNILSRVTDTEVSRALKMRKAVNRDRHKMKAFVRFRRTHAGNNVICESGPLEQDYYIAWFEPTHLILPLTTDFFVSRFANMSWSILTPDACAHWDQTTLTVTEGLPQKPNIEDEIEKLWLTYYAHIFNPSRLKVKAMQAEMPKKYWLNLPEAALIQGLVRTSTHRMETMLAQSPLAPWHKTEQSKYVKTQQVKLRSRNMSKKD